MSDEAAVVLSIVIPVAAFVIGGLLGGHRRKTPNVRVPRKTLWSRTNDYHERERQRESQQLVMHDVKDWTPSILRRQAD